MPLLSDMSSQNSNRLSGKGGKQKKLTIRNQIQAEQGTHSKKNMKIWL